jgi:hypothetical protein
VQPGDAVRGRQNFGACAACHSLEPDRNMTGPSLANLWGRKAGGLVSFERYSDALKSSGTMISLLSCKRRADLTLRSVARQNQFVEADQSLLPWGKSLRILRNRVKPRKQKYSASHFCKSELQLCRLIPEEGRWPSSPSVGMGCGGRGQRRASFRAGRSAVRVRRSRVVLAPRRWRQACGVICR